MFRLLTVVVLAALLGTACTSQRSVDAGAPRLATDPAPAAVATSPDAGTEGAASGAPATPGDASADTGDASAAPGLVIDLGLDDDRATAGTGDDTTGDAGGGFTLDLGLGGDTSAGATGNDAMSAFSRSVATTSAQGSYRGELTLGMEMRGLGADISMPQTTLATVEVDGGRTKTVVDLGPMMTAMVGSFGDDASLTELFGADLTSSVITDGTTTWLRSPMFEQLATQLADLGDANPLGPFVGNGTRWFRIDAAFDADAVNNALGGMGTASADQVLAVLRSQASEVTNAGAAEVRGVATTRYVATFSLADLQPLLGTVEGNFTGSLASDLESIEWTVDVHADAQGLIRRVELQMDLADLAVAAGQPAAVDGVTATMSMRQDFFDFGDPSIAVEAPADALDGSFLVEFIDLMG